MELALCNEYTLLFGSKFSWLVKSIHVSRTGLETRVEISRC
jgi:hypothetical protein